MLRMSNQLASFSLHSAFVTSFRQIMSDIEQANIAVP